MGCGTCATGACGTTTAGCNSNGGCGSGGCNKLNSFDWFAGMLPPGTSENQAIYEVRFKNTRKGFYRNTNGLPLITGDLVVVESDRGFDVGQISLSGVLATLQMRKKRVKPKERIPKIYRLALDEDLEKLKKARSRELSTMIRTREIVKEIDLEMKVSDVEFQGDNTKAIFYYIADQRVDFRRLIKMLADEFRIRVEMKQIGLRHEAGLVGGIGSCGRELCCSTWLTDFKTVSTSAARYQNLSLNPMKISGQCGRLKCCLNFELETYLNALEDIPNVDRIETELGLGRHQKTDIFKRIMWFSYEGESSWIPLTVDNVNEMMRMNKEGIKPASLRALDDVVEEEMDFVDVVGQSVLRADPKRKGKGKGRNKGKGGQQNREGRDGRGPRPERKGGPQNAERGENVQNQERKGGSENAEGGGNPQNQERRGGPQNNEGRNRGRGRGRNQGPQNRNQGEGRPPREENPNRQAENRTGGEGNPNQGGEGNNQNRGQGGGRNNRGRGGQNRNNRGRGGNRRGPNAGGGGPRPEGGPDKGPPKPDNPS
ncbi:MAG: hypothetical protein H6581_07775 [Bacteroidia bacterium]|nr:hypothetical protein [Bacteroidia bacterium]